MFSGQFTYGDMFSIVLVLGIGALVILGSVLIAVLIITRKK